MHRRLICSGTGRLVLLLCILMFSGCRTQEKSDGYGNFEATEIIVSAEASGKLLRLDVEEGSRLTKGTPVALVDTTQLHLSRTQLQAERGALVTKRPSLVARIGVLQAERSNRQRDQNRYRRLVQEGAAPSRQLEDIENAISVLDKEIASLATEEPAIAREILARDARIGQIDDQIRKSLVLNPVDGVVLNRYAEAGEVTSYGKPLYKIADLGNLFLRVYLAEADLPRVKIGQEVEVLIDGEKAGVQSLKGRVTWISSKAEFTPKIIQTREERVSMVYAVKVLVDNRRGVLKIGMPGEVRLAKLGGK